MSATMRQPHFAGLLGLAWLLVMLQLVAQHFGETAQTLNDTDDAMRLAQLKDWLGGQGWYDLNYARIAQGYESHWSRLIDAGLASTLWVFGLVAPPDLAERLMRSAWPMLWLLPTMAGTAAIAWRIAGREAALLALLLALVGLPAFHQFKPGRIDHHNVQIALSVLVVAATVWSDRTRWAAAAAGALTGLALAIGLESLPYLLICAAAFATRYLVDRAGARAAADYGLALASSSVLGFLLAVDPGHWGRGVCDAIALNWLALVLLGGLGLWLAGTRFASDRMPVRLALVGATGLLAAALFVWIDPRCLAGPYAMMEPAVWAIWLSHVREMKPLVALMVDSPVSAVAIATFPVTALIAAVLLLRDATMRRDFGYLAATAAFVSAFVTTLAAIKAYSYATWLGMPLVAAFAVHLFAALRLHSLLPRFAVGLMLTPTVLTLGATSIANASGLQNRENLSRAERAACIDTANYAALERLPKGLIAADIDFGPFLLALTRHDVVAAPYHRLSGGILAAHAIFASPPDAARLAAQRLGVTYVLTCGPRPPGNLDAPRLAASLWGRLQANDIPAWLERVPGVDRPFQIYRVKS